MWGKGKKKCIEQSQLERKTLELNGENVFEKKHLQCVCVSDVLVKPPPEDSEASETWEH